MDKLEKGNSVKTLTVDLILEDVRGCSADDIVFQANQLIGTPNQQPFVGKLEDMPAQDLYKYVDKFIKEYRMLVENMGKVSGDQDGVASLKETVVKSLNKLESDSSFLNLE